nr:MMPL family transporter [Actinomadura madurae]
MLIVAVVGLLAAATPALGLRLGLPDDGTAPPGTTQRQAYDLLAEGFGPGINGPLTLVVQAGDGTKAAAERVAATITALDGVASVDPPVVNPARRHRAGRRRPRHRADGRGHRGPHPHHPRPLLGRGDRRGHRADRDRHRHVREARRRALVPYLAVVVGLAFLLLTLVFRSILVPLKATLGFLLSVAATFGAVVAVFQEGRLEGPLGVHASGVIVNVLPVMLIGMVFGLAMDYQVFLVTRMREEHVRGASPTGAAVAGLAHGSRVVTAAAIIMIFVFAGFLLSATPMVQSFGFALAAAVLFDAFVVRMTIVPAVMALLGRAGWWLPARLARVLPHVDVEGERLRDAPGEVTVGSSVGTR